MSRGLAGSVLMLAAVSLGIASSHASEIVYDTWTTNENGTGNYILTVDDDTAGKFSFEFTVDPWNAEGLGVFVDLGDFDFTTPPTTTDLTGVSPAGEVAIYATDTSSDVCGGGCNVSGLNPPLANPDEEWELVFRLADNGFDGIQTFLWQTDRFGLTLNNFGLVAVRSQVLCSGDDLLPVDNGSCDGSDKSYGSPGGPNPPTGNPTPTPLALIGLGGLLLGWMRRKRAM